jgi:hypothetical protein
MLLMVLILTFYFYYFLSCDITVYNPFKVRVDRITKTFTEIKLFTNSSQCLKFY